MVIVSSEIVYRLSGGGSNTDPMASLGGAKSSTALTDNSLNNLYADSLGTESAAGSTKYRAIYYHNGNASLTALNARVYITGNTPSTDDTIAVGVGSAAINGTEQTVANENTAPTSVTFSTAAVDYASGLALGDIPAGQHKAIWFRRVITAGASAYDNDTLVFEVGVDSAA